MYGDAIQAYIQILDVGSVLKDSFIFLYEIYFYIILSCHTLKRLSVSVSTPVYTGCKKKSILIVKTDETVM